MLDAVRLSRTLRHMQSASACGACDTLHAMAWMVTMTHHNVAIRLLCNAQCILLLVFRGQVAV